MHFLTHVHEYISSPLIYLLVAVLLLLESTGIPLINTTLLLFVGAMAGQGQPNLPLLLFSAVVGSVVGACCAYRLGQSYGEGLILRLAHFMRVKPEKLQFIERWFQGAGGRMIFLSRILPYVRPFACFPAGITGMPFGQFLLAATGGSLLWCTTLLLIGWELGPRWRLAMHLMQDYTLPTLVVLAVLLIGLILIRRALNRQMERRLLARKPQ